MQKLHADLTILCKCSKLEFQGKLSAGFNTIYNRDQKVHINSSFLPIHLVGVPHLALCTAIAKFYNDLPLCVIYYLLMILSFL